MFLCACITLLRIFKYQHKIRRIIHNTFYKVSNLQKIPMPQQEKYKLLNRKCNKEK
jgi:hypothetical protein